jgi:hypothetical protein
MRIKQSLPLAASAALVGISALPGFAANLVQNPGFELSTPVNTSTYPTSAGGLGQLVQVVTVPNWTRTIINDPGSGGFAFIVDATADNRTTGASYPGQGGGFPSQNSPTANTNIFLWGPDYGPSPVSNGFTGSPNGGKFLGIDGDYGASKVSQTISGLTAGDTYTFSFEYAGAQESGEQGATDQKWIFGYNGILDQVSWVNPTQGFTPWQTYTTTFTAASSSFDLSFEAWGRAVSGSGSLPPFLLLDNVQILDSTNPPPIPPTPPVSTPGPLPLVGLGVAFSWSRRVRQRLLGRA